jgi:hypothetical protein
MVKKYINLKARPFKVIHYRKQLVAGCHKQVNFSFCQRVKRIDIIDVSHRVRMSGEPLVEHIGIG